MASESSRARAATASVPRAGTARAARRRPGWRPRPALRKALLIAHVVSSVGWLGIDVVLLFLAVTGLTSDDPALVLACYTAIGAFVDLLLIPASLLSLATGMLLGLGTRWGLIRYWWVTVKLAVTVVLSTLVLVLLRPVVDDLTAGVRAADPDGSLRAQLGMLPTNLVFPPSVSIAALLFATVLSVYKPWRTTPFAGREPGTR